MTRQLGIFGHPLAHTVSPAMHQAALDHLGLDIRYTAWPTEAMALPESVRRLRRDDHLGANVTIPHKERVLDLLEGFDSGVKEVGAANTIVKRNGRLMGINTDVEGFLKALKERAGFELPQAAVLLLGAGGAARAAAFGLAIEGVASLAIANRTLPRALSLAEELRDRVPRVTGVPMETSSMKAACAEAGLIVNATSVGMAHSSGQARSLLASELIRPDTLVFDMVYSPAETPLMKEARRAGARAMGGLWMLVYQGAASFRLWTGLEAPVEVMHRAAERAVAATIAAR